MTQNSAPFFRITMKNGLLIVQQDTSNFLLTQINAWQQEMMAIWLWWNAQKEIVFNVQIGHIILYWILGGNLEDNRPSIYYWFLTFSNLKFWVWWTVRKKSSAANSEFKLENVKNQVQIDRGEYCCHYNWQLFHFLMAHCY